MLSISNRCRTGTSHTFFLHWDHDVVRIYIGMAREDDVGQGY